MILGSMISGSMISIGLTVVTSVTVFTAFASASTVSSISSVIFWNRLSILNTEVAVAVFFRLISVLSLILAILAHSN